MMTKRFKLGVTVMAMVLCLGLGVMAAAQTEVADDSASLETVLAELAAAVDTSEVAEEVRERLAGYVAELAGLVGDEQTADALLAAVTAAIDSAEGEYKAFLTGVKVALEAGTFGPELVAVAAALAADDALAAADADVWTQLLTVEVAAE